MTLGQSQSKMLKWIVLPVLIVLLMSWVSYVFRNPIGQFVGSFWLPENTQISCIDYDISVSEGVHINQLCVDQVGLELRIEDAFWRVTDVANLQSSLAISRLHIKHTQDYTTQADSNEDSDIATLVPKTLPSYLPILTIKQAVIESYLLDLPLHLTLKQRTPQELHLGGDLNAEIALEQGKLAAQVSWNIQQIMSMSTTLQQAIEPYSSIVDWPALLASPIVSHLSFDGRQLFSEHQMQMQSPVEYNGCSAQFLADGKLVAEWDVVAQSFRVNLHHLPVKFTQTGCANLTKVILPADLVATVTVPKVIVFQNKLLEVPEVNVVLSNNKDNLQLQILDSTIDTDMNIQTNYSVLLSAQLAGYLDTSYLQQALIELDSKGVIEANAAQWSVRSTQSNLLVEQLQGHDYELASSQGKYNYTVQHSPDKAIAVQLSGNQSVAFLTSELGGSSATMEQGSIDWVLNNPSNEAWHLQLDVVGQKVSSSVANLSQIRSKIEVNLDAGKLAHITGTSVLTGISLDKYTIKKVDVTHAVDMALEPFSVTGKHDFSLNSALTGLVSHQAQSYSIELPPQSVKLLKPWIKQFEPKLDPVSGTFSAKLNNQATSGGVQGRVSLTDVSLGYDDFQVLMLNIDEPFTLDSGSLQLDKAKIRVDEVNVGVPIKNVEAQLSVAGSEFTLNYASGNLLGGAIHIAEMRLDTPIKKTNIDLTGLDLEKLVELHDQPGIKVNGSISGEMPIRVATEVPLIESGKLSSDGPGTLRISKNAAFDSIKAQQSELSLLENVNFDHLSSQVNLSSDGWLDLAFSIEGRNPEKNQAVIFNYGHKQNIFTLLKSMRITNSMQNSIEQRIQQGTLKQGK
ncbi:YdbH domain-containing protein [Aliiglaciecola sp. LCG003]|uniref:YdbH domain-containing protein n=1 Tax=Aliiglaciecola sp. LCG003 TaxID=3053655 RepID=UPI00257336D3|nr:YdbH domain-containing protein [Aliiglaciecola sp. LCG003]WJG10685.1 YdbH domain-containing protein [Aliiglaciecola sp. LCG003]